MATKVWEPRLSGVYTPANNGPSGIGNYGFRIECFSLLSAGLGQVRVILENLVEPTNSPIIKNVSIGVAATVPGIVGTLPSSTFAELLFSTGHGIVLPYLTPQPSDWVNFSMFSSGATLLVTFDGDPSTVGGVGYASGIDNGNGYYQTPIPQFDNASGPGWSNSPTNSWGIVAIETQTAPAGAAGPVIGGLLGD